MALLLGGKLQLPMSTGALTCICKNVRCLSLSAQRSTPQSPNANYEINPEFRNRNPRNLEKMALAWKRTGWKFQQPKREFYHQLQLHLSKKNMSATVEHWNGTFKISVSTKHPELKHYLAGVGGATKASFLGQITAQRCLDAGITHVYYDTPEDKSIKETAFQEGLEKMNLILKEPDRVEQAYRPGIDYSKPNRYGERKLYKDDYQVA